MILRPLSLAPGERSFVLASWVNSFASSDMAKLATFGGVAPRGAADWHASPAYYATWNALGNAVLERANVTIADDLGLVAGFMVWAQERETIVHYVYTRLSYRQQGVARELIGTLPLGPVVYTHRSRSIRAVPANWRFSLAPLFGVVERQREAA